MSLPAANLLADSSSPYLRQHATNPVHWRTWTPDALAEASSSGRPILLSIGYAACHWCHVMAHESFEDPDTAALMNSLFVNIKVDREERPDLDHLYMTALHALGEQGGWPLTMFLTPQARPFWGGTYFPPTPRWGRPSFRQVLAGVAQAFQNEHEKVAANATALSEHLTRLNRSNPGRDLTPDDLTEVGDRFLSLIDMRAGGLRGAPKFPNAPIMNFLWSEAWRRSNLPLRSAVVRSVEAMCAGGIYDHIGGGTARYSVDANWLVPHFEKMLYDNAQLLDLLALVHAQAPSPVLVRRADRLVSWLVREMRSPQQASHHRGFVSAIDADSEGEEGAFYVWSQAEVETVLTVAGLQSLVDEFKRAYGVTESGNWEGKNILFQPDPDTESAASRAAREERLEPALSALLAARGRRPRPATDGKVLADWNGLAITALVRAAGRFDRPEWITLAEDTARFVLAHMQVAPGRLAHSWLDRPSVAGLLEDHAQLSLALVHLFEATGEISWLQTALRLLEPIDDLFGDGEGGFFQTAADTHDLPVRVRQLTDGPTPSGVAALAQAWARIHLLTSDRSLRDRLYRLVGRHSGPGFNPAAMPALLQALSALESAIVIVLTGDPASSTRQSMHRIALASGDPRVVVLPASDQIVLDQSHPAHGKPLHVTAAYVCQAGVCSLPITDLAALKQRLAWP